MLQATPAEQVSQSIIPYSVMLTSDGSIHSSTTGPHFNPQEACRALEHGGILYFPETPFPLSAEDRQFLLSQKQLESPRHKNIAYRPHEDRVTGVKAGGDLDIPRLHAVLQSYCYQTRSFLEHFLAPYAANWTLDYTSFRPLEEQGRKLRLRARNDLLHVDSFPTRPTYGGRIFRVFTNLHPTRVRIWRTSNTLEQLLAEFSTHVKPPADLSQTQPPSASVLMNLAKYFGLKRSAYSPYDRWMTQFHNFLKENKRFQAQCRKDTWEFPPGSSWMVMTDMVSHSVLSGQYAMEQTFIVDLADMVEPQMAPIHLLRRVY